MRWVVGRERVRVSFPAHFSLSLAASERSRVGDACLHWKGLHAANNSAWNCFVIPSLHCESPFCDSA